MYLFRSAITVFSLTTLSIFSAALASADDQHNDLHFSHPLFTESPSPDTKIRADYIFQNENGEEESDTHTARLEGEYAFRPWISVEIDIPVTVRDFDDGRSKHSLDTVEVGVKLASFALADHGVLLGGGIEFGLPTGNSSKEIGSSHTLEVEPFLDLGFKRGNFEFVSFLSTGVPVNENGEDEADVELELNASILYHLDRRFQAILEFDFERVFGGEEAGHVAASISPGFKLVPTANEDFQIGAAVSLPLRDEKDFHVRAIFSAFYHF